MRTSAKSKRSAPGSKRCCRNVPGTRSVFAERVAGGYFLDFDLKRDQLARYGLTVADAQNIVMSAIGGENITTTVEGRARYPVNIRYPRELRDNVERLREVLVPTPSGAQIPIAQIADIKKVTGPSMLRDENGMLAGYVFVDLVLQRYWRICGKGQGNRQTGAAGSYRVIPWSGAASTKTCCACASG